MYLSLEDGRLSLNKVKTTGDAPPVVLKALDVSPPAWGPVWSPANDWILHNDGGLKSISPDGKTTRDISAPEALVKPSRRTAERSMASGNPSRWVLSNCFP